MKFRPSEGDKLDMKKSDLLFASLVVKQHVSERIEDIRSFWKTHRSTPVVNLDFTVFPVVVTMHPTESFQYEPPLTETDEMKWLQILEHAKKVLSRLSCMRPCLKVAIQNSMCTA